jgi:transcriptional regulator with XRE-family HTH domain
MNESTKSVSTFGHIYQKALKIQLEKMGSTLRLLRKARQEEIDTVAAAVNIRPEILEKIEGGEHDMRVKTLFALCEYFNVDGKELVGKGELIWFRCE